MSAIGLDERDEEVVFRLIDEQEMCIAPEGGTTAAVPHHRTWPVRVAVVRERAVREQKNSTG